MISRRIALDISSLDFMSVGGQIRYATDLIRGLANEEGFETVVIGSSPEPIEAIRDLAANPSVPCEYRQFVRSTNRGGSYLDPIRLGALLHREKIDLFHALHTLIPLRARCAVVATAYDTMYEVFDEYAEARRSRPYRMHLWFLRRRVDRVICISESTARDATKYWGLDPARLDVVYPGLDQLPLEHESSGRFPDFPYVLAPFNLEPRKNLKSLLEAFASVRGRHPRLRLVLFGRSGMTVERERDFNELVARLDLREGILSTGVVSEAMLAGLYSGAELFVFPSLYEGFGYPVLEAMAAGTCVLARPVSAMAEVLGEAGAFVEVSDPSALASELESLLGDQARRARLAAAARVRAKSFSVERMTRGTVSAYKRVLGAR